MATLIARRSINYHYAILQHHEDDDGIFFALFETIIKAPVITARMKLNYDPDINKENAGTEGNNNEGEIRRRVRFSAL